MSLIYNFKEFEKRVNDRITIKLSFFDKNSNTYEYEYIQGILKSVDMEKEILQIEQHFTYYNVIHNIETSTVVREFKNKNFYLISCGNFKESK